MLYCTVLLHYTLYYIPYCTIYSTAYLLRGALPYHGDCPACSLADTLCSHSPLRASGADGGSGLEPEVPVPYQPPEVGTRSRPRLPWEPCWCASFRAHGVYASFRGHGDGYCEREAGRGSGSDSSKSKSLCVSAISFLTVKYGRNKPQNLIDRRPLSSPSP